MTAAFAVRRARSATGDVRPGLPWRSRCRRRWVRSLASKLAVLLVWVVPVVWAAVEDARSARLPDRITLGGAGARRGGGVWWRRCGRGVVVDAWRAAGMGGVLLGGVLAVMHVASPRGLGFGDVKYGVLWVSAWGSCARGWRWWCSCRRRCCMSSVAWWRPWPAQRRPQARSWRRHRSGRRWRSPSIGWVVVVLASGGGV